MVRARRHGMATVMWLTRCASSSLLLLPLHVPQTSSLPLPSFLPSPPCRSLLLLPPPFSFLRARVDLLFQRRRNRSALYSSSATKQLQMQSQDLSSCLAALQGAQTPSQDSILSLARACVPPLGEKTSKGEAGRVGVIGGSFEYTGAPYFAAYTALRAGSDIVHIFCETRAGGPIKSYSPELIVHPLLLVSDDPTVSMTGREERGAAAYQQLSEWVARLDGILLGPGLGRDELVLQTCSRLLLLVAELGKPMILDADGLYILTQAIREGERGSSLQKQLLGAMRTAHVTLTPNKVEFERLCRALKVGEEEEDKLGKAAELACSVAGRIGENVVLVVKGSSDVICSDSSTWLCDDKGSLRRAGGQGDVLAGLMLTFAVWGFMAAKRMEETKTGRREELQLLRMSCCLAACKVAKLSALKAFEKKKRAMTASDVMEEVGSVFDIFFGEEGK